MGRHPRRTLTILLCVMVLLILYGSTMPFLLSTNAPLIERSFRQAWEYWPLSDARHVSKTDLISNVLLYLPLGFLLAARVSVGRGGAVRAILSAVILGLLLSATVEAAQLFLPSRITAVNDLATNTIGALLGSLGGVLLGRRSYIRIRRSLRLAWFYRPLHIAAGAVLGYIILESLAPYRPTLDISTVWSHVKASAWSLPEGFARKSALLWLMDRFLPWTILGALWMAAQAKPREAARRCALVLPALAGLLEVAKLGIVGKAEHANLVSWIIASAGGLSGAALAALFRDRIAPRRWLGVALLLLGAWTIWVYWAPLNFTLDGSLVRTKLPAGRRWLPLYSHLARGHALDFWLMARAMLLGAAMALLLRLWWYRQTGGRCRPRMLLWAFGMGSVGLALEAGQCFLPSRWPGTGDILCYAAGGAIGALLACRSIQRSPAWMKALRST